MKESAYDPLRLYRAINRDGAVAALKGAAAAGVSRFVFLSSVKVLGETTSGRRPFANSDAPCPEDAYAQSKVEAEATLADVAAQLGVELVVLRLPLVYGRDVGGNIAVLLKAVRSGIWLPFGRAYNNRRSMISTLNLADAVRAALTAPRAAGHFLLVSDGQDLSTRQLIEQLATSVGVVPRLLNVPEWAVRLALRATGRTALWSRLFQDLRVDISDSCDRLEWRPQFGVAEGLTATSDQKTNGFE